MCVCKWGICLYGMCVGRDLDVRRLRGAFFSVRGGRHLYGVFLKSIHSAPCPFQSLSSHHLTDLPELRREGEDEPLRLYGGGSACWSPASAASAS